MIQFLIAVGIFVCVFGQDAMCPCQKSKQLFWHSTTNPIPHDSFNSSEVALILDTARGCENLCFCAENGTCYAAQTQKHAYLQLIPFCEKAICHMYGAVFDEIYQNFAYEPMKSDAGELYSSPDPYNQPVGINSTYVKVKAVGCSGCQALKNLNLSTCTARH